MATNLGGLVAFTQSLSGHDQPEVVVGKALECALAVLRETAGVALIRTPQGLLQVTARQGMSQAGETAVQALCEPGNPVVRAIEDCRCQLVTVEDDRLVPEMRFPRPGKDGRRLVVIPFVALGESFGGVVLFLHQEPDKLVWEEYLPYISAAAGVALAQPRLKETIAKQGRLASLGRLAAGVAHELRNPLTILGVTLELLRYDPQVGGEARTKLDLAQDAFQRVAQLIDGLAGYSKPTKATADLVLLSDLFSTLVKLLDPEARSRQIKIGVWTSPPSLAIRGGRGQLLEVLINLVENAMDAIERDGRITLQAELAGGAVRISVRDSGPGIAPERLDRIFDPFFTTKANGTGLGLAIVREIVERFGGTIRVESQPGGGSEFTVTFPSALGNDGRVK